MRAERLRLAALLVERHQRRKRRFADYHPTPPQRAFHAAGAGHRERLLMAGNQLGKTWVGANELAMHLTGAYPDWWQGRRFEGAIQAWLGSVSQEVSRATVQRLLLSQSDADPLNLRGLIPAGWQRAGGLAGADEVLVPHRDGGQSTLAFKSYAQGRERWQGASLDLVWFDEEPAHDVYMEGLTRTNATGGLVFATFTPLLGRTTLVERFVGQPHADRSLITMRLEDAAHLSAEDRRRILASYPPHEREVRANGIPVLGSGRVFDVPEDVVTVSPFDIPAHWPRVGALDFGWDHPTAAVEVAWDRDRDVAYVLRCYRQRHATPQVHAAVLLGWGRGLVWVWPHDGLAHDKTSGVTLAHQYRAQGLSMHPERVTFPDGSNGLEAGVMDMLQRLQSGRLRVFSGAPDWFEEYRLYHRKSGQIVSERDDLLSATRYALMGLRHARTTKDQSRPHARRDGGAFNPLDW